MGCGGSKGVAVAASQAPPGNAPATKQETASVIVVRQDPASVQPVTPKQAAPSVKSGSSTETEATEDSGYDETIITEKTKNVDDIVAQRPPTPDLAIEGKCMTVPDVPAFESEEDASVPVVMNRPSSRGGLAFDITYEEAPKSQRLEKLQSRAQKAKPELTIQELQAKLAAAEQRRKDHEKRLTDKMAKESEKISSAQKPEPSSDTGEDRAAHFKSLSEQMKTKTDAGVSVRHSNEHLPAL